MGQLYFGDNLDILRESIPVESVDLIYLDPPFNSKRDHNLLSGVVSFKKAKAETVVAEQPELL